MLKKIKALHLTVDVYVYGWSGSAFEMNLKTGFSEGFTLHTV